MAAQSRTQEMTYTGTFQWRIRQRRPVDDLRAVLFLERISIQKGTKNSGNFIPRQLLERKLAINQIRRSFKSNGDSSRDLLSDLQQFRRIIELWSENRGVMRLAKGLLVLIFVLSMI